MTEFLILLLPLTPLLVVGGWLWCLHRIFIIMTRKVKK